MPTADESDVRVRLAPFFSPISRAFHRAWERWRELPGAASFRCKRTRANVVWEYLIDEISRAFAESNRVRLIKDGETFLFVVDGCLAFRAKKGDESGLSSNIPTQAVLAYHDPEQELPGIPQVSRVEIIYVLNKLETAIADVRAVAREGSRVAWSFSLVDHSANVVGMPTVDVRSQRGDADTTNVGAKVVRLKGRTDEANRADESKK